MQIGLVGLGRMGANMSRRWLRSGHTVVGYARHAETVNGLLADKAISAGPRPWRTSWRSSTSRGSCG